MTSVREISVNKCETSCVTRASAAFREGDHEGALKWAGNEWGEPASLLHQLVLLVWVEIISLGHINFLVKLKLLTKVQDLIFFLKSS